MELAIRTYDNQTQYRLVDERHGDKGQYLSTRSTLVPDNADWPDTSWQPQGDQDNILKVTPSTHLPGNTRSDETLKTLMKRTIKPGAFAASRPD
ncbi:hypothetical protein CIB48_g4501 [Xylaria polymorpha]|nr:hypothetical protein CIB48_g4501 [Xylaria polymorpha]